MKDLQKKKTKALTPIEHAHVIKALLEASFDLLYDPPWSDSRFNFKSPARPGEPSIFEFYGARTIGLLLVDKGRGALEARVIDIPSSAALLAEERTHTDWEQVQQVFDRFTSSWEENEVIRGKHKCR